jgi:hypothetical protein
VLDELALQSRNAPFQLSEALEDRIPDQFIRIPPGLPFYVPAKSGDFGQDLFKGIHVLADFVEILVFLIAHNSLLGTGPSSR